MQATPMILKTDPGGRPIRWINVRLAAGYLLRDEVIWASPATAAVLRGGISARSGHRSRLAVPSIVAVAGARGRFNDAMVPRLTNPALFLRDRHLCCYCGNGFAGRSALLTRDHVMPLSRGGSDIWENVVTSCRACNQKKDNRLIEECGLEMRYIPYTPSWAEAMILENRRILSDQMDFLMAQLPREQRRRRAATAELSRVDTAG
jgi:hypothetical protein